MKNRILIYITLLLLLNLHLNAQEIPAAIEQQMENITEQVEEEPTDDSYLQDLEIFRKHPININLAELAELQQLRMLNALQIDNFLLYRARLGNFISIYELQSIPAWDIETIRKLLSFLTVTEIGTIKSKMFPRFLKGQHQLVFRVGQALEKEKIDTGYNAFIGSPQKVFLRYRYSYNNLIQYGIVAEKDAGEPILKKNKAGFDFYSFHLYIRKYGIVENLALGDYTVSMGQGLIHWQSQAFHKSSETMGVKRQSPVLRPFNSTGEYAFKRGAGITVRLKKFSLTWFGSYRKLSGNIVEDLETKHVSSLLLTGYHRSKSEVSEKNNLTEICSGMAVGFRMKEFTLNLNAIGYKFSLPIIKRAEPYNLFALQGNRWANGSVDFSWTHNNMHWFGEYATDIKGKLAGITGLIISPDRRMDLSLVVRHISIAYHSLNGNAFTENSEPSNESGAYIGISIKPLDLVRIDAYADVYKFPWLRFATDAPGWGRDYLFQLTYQPNKIVECYTRFKFEAKRANSNDLVEGMHNLVAVPKKNLRTHFSVQINRSWTFRNRVELVWIDQFPEKKEGFLFYCDLLFNPVLKPYSIGLRFEKFETSDYASRVYAYENDVMYSFSIPAVFGIGTRFYVNGRYNINKMVACWFRYACTISSVQQRTADMKIQIAINF